MILNVVNDGAFEASVDQTACRTCRVWLGRPEAWPDQGSVSGVGEGP